MAAVSNFSTRSVPVLVWLRASIGLGQGIGCWLLYSATQAHVWPATAPIVFAPLLFVFLFVPIAALTGLGNLRPATWAAWLTAALLLAVVIGLHQAARQPAAALEFAERPEVAAALALALFIGQSLVAAGDADRRVFAAYPTYFDTAWKFEVQLLLSSLFLGLFWGVLWLGAGLFQLIDLNFFGKLIAKPAFAMPASALAFASGLHVTDIRVGLVQGCATCCTCCCPGCCRWRRCWSSASS